MRSWLAVSRGAPPESGLALSLDREFTRCAPHLTHSIRDHSINTLPHLSPPPTHFLCISRFQSCPAGNIDMAVEESRSSSYEPEDNPHVSARSPGDKPDEDGRSPEDAGSKLQPFSGVVNSSNHGSPRSGEDVPPLPDEAPPSEVEQDDGWQALWDQNVQAFYF